MNPRRRRILRGVLISILSAVLVLIAAAIVILHTGWFREYARRRAIQAIEHSTGGRAQIGSLTFEWRHFGADIRDFIVRGSEPASAPPLFQAREIRIRLRLISFFESRRLELQALTVDQPQVNLMVFPDGRTNLPKPTQTGRKDPSALQTMVNLAIRRFTINQGTIAFLDHHLPFSASGENLSALLDYQSAVSRYRGAISIDPLFVQSGSNPALHIAVNLPLVLERDRIELANATFTTPESSVRVSGGLSHLVSPRISARAAARVSLPEMTRALGLKLNASVGSPHLLLADVNVHSGSGNQIASTVNLVLGQSRLDASGNFNRESFRDGSVQFSSSLNLAELSRLLQPAESSRVGIAGTADIAGNAILHGAAGYAVDAQINASGLDVARGNTRIENASFAARISASPQAIVADSIRAAVAGGQIGGSARLEKLSKYSTNLTLSGFRMEEILAIAAPSPRAAKRLDWSGIISGQAAAEGDLHASAQLQARARLAISPGHSGIPIRGDVNAQYAARTGILDLGRSFIALPSSRLDFSGSLGQQINVRLLSRDLNDFQPAIEVFSSRPPSAMPVRLSPGGSAEFDATVRGKLASPVISGHLDLSRFQIEQRRFDRLSADLNARSNRVEFRDASLMHGALNAHLTVAAGLDHWEPASLEPLEADLSIQNADLLDALAFAGQTGIPAQGSLTAAAHVSGTFGNPQGRADISITKGNAYGQPLDRAEAHFEYGGQTFAIPSVVIVSGKDRLTANGSFTHPQNDFSSGAFRAHADTDSIALQTIEPLRQARPDLDGNLQLNLDTSGELHSATPRLRLTALNGAIHARGLKLKGDNLGDVALTAETHGQRVAFGLTSNFAGSTVRAGGLTNLAAPYATSANLSIRNLPLEKTLTAAGGRSLAIRGVLSANGTVGGTLDDPHASLNAAFNGTGLVKAIDRAQGHLDYARTKIDLSSFEAQAGPNRITLSASFSHSPGSFTSGTLEGNLKTNTLQLAQLRAARALVPDLAGTAEVSLDTAAALEPPSPGASLASRIVLSRLNGRVSASGLRAKGQDYGGFTASADQSGQMVALKLDSNLAQSEIHGTAQARLTRDDPIQAQFTFANVRYSNWAALLKGPVLGSLRADALLEGRVNVSGPALDPESLTGEAQLSKAELYTSAPALGSAQNATELALRNDGPVMIVASRSGIQIQRAHWTGPATDLELTGNMALRPAVTLGLNVKANADLALLQKIDSNFSAGGKIALNASIKGTPEEPSVNGAVSLSKVAFQETGWPNGISNATGTIQLNGNSARIETLTAESGGGRVSFSGSVTRSGPDFIFALQSRGNDIMVLTSAGVSATANSNLRLTGTSQSSALSGNVNIQSVGFQSQTDLGSLLSQTAAPEQTPAAQKGLLANMKLDIAVRMSSGASFRTSYAENLEAEADLTLRGTVASPAIVGRINVTQGSLIFFGTKYTINEGSITFYNLSKIEPILNLNLEVAAQGVDVILSVTGPVQNMNFSYHSDPPLPFSDIVGLLAAGRTPTSDPVLLANQPLQPQQNFQQMGESALVGAAVANPVAGQLQRVFGVTQLKINPSFVSGSELPQARVTLQQRISANITFTYITDLTNSNPQIVRVEWTISPQWSAVAERDENGLFGVDFFYKHRFR